jgi:predicted site-specific integrase-resolvase
MKDKLCSPKETAKILGVTVTTLQNWDRAGKIKATRTPQNRRMFPESEIKQILGVDTIEESRPLKYAVYARVSSNEQKQKGDLKRQIDFLVENVPCHNKNEIIVFSDVGSGLNDKRKNLINLMNRASKGEFTHLYIRYRDRLTRFGFNYIELFFKSHGVEIVVLEKSETQKSIEDELVEDLVAIMTSFSGKLHGLRRNKNKIDKNTTLEVKSCETILQNTDSSFIE